MPVRSIVRLGHPALRSPARPLAPGEVGRGDVQDLIDDMIETMRAASGVGLAAPQVGFERQIFVYEASLDHREPGSERPEHLEIPLRVVINPMVTPASGELVYDWEGCLSIPDLRGLVPRHPAVRVRCLDRSGRPVDFIAAGFEARIVQHEFDHLNGILFLDRMRDLRSLSYTEERARYMAGDLAEAESTALA